MRPPPSRIRTSAATGLLALTIPLAASAPPDPPDVPLVSGTHVVLAVSNFTLPEQNDAGVVLGDYEMVVELTEVTPDRVTQTASVDGVDKAGVRRSVKIPRIVSSADLEGAREQVFGFHTSDPVTVPGATSLGPSRTVARDLVRTGATPYGFRNFSSHGLVTGTLRRTSDTRVPFPVLLSGRRVVLEAVHAAGQMSLGGVSRPFETVILDHPQYPLSLRIAYGPRGGAHPFEPEFVREVVRIDLPAEATTDTALGAECRVELSGIYFDFNQATLKPESGRALEELAGTLRRQGTRRFTIEGHTDDIGSDRYNDDLSARRAAAVMSALVGDHGIDASRLATVGHGERRPVERNDTLAGRARNRRVELVCAPL